MPLTDIPHRKARILPFLAGLLPESDNALRAVGARFGANPRNPVGLLEHIGADIAGAVWIGPCSTDPDLGSLETETHFSEMQLGELLRQVQLEYRDATPLLPANARLSLAGARAKLPMHQAADGGWWLPSPSRPSTHILKPLPAELPNLDVVEAQTMLAAKHLGLDVATPELQLFGEIRTYIVERYDRKLGATGQVSRVHQEDLCQALAVSPEKKYQSDGGPGTSSLRDLTKRIANADSKQGIRQAFFRALAFNVMTHSSDAHAKNYSFLLEGNSVRLAPLYDLATTAVFPQIQQKSAMAINGKYAFSEIGKNDLVIEARRLELDEAWASHVVESLGEGLVDAFASAGAALTNAWSNDAIAASVANTTAAIEQIRKGHR